MFDVSITRNIEHEVALDAFHGTATVDVQPNGRVSAALSGRAPRTARERETKANRSTNVLMKRSEERFLGVRKVDLRGVARCDVKGQSVARVALFDGLNSGTFWHARRKSQLIPGSEAARR